MNLDVNICSVCGEKNFSDQDFFESKGICSNCIYNAIAYFEALYFINNKSILYLENIQDFDTISKFYHTFHRLNSLKIDVENAKENSDFNKAAEIEYGKIPELYENRKIIFKNIEDKTIDLLVNLASTYLNAKTSIYALQRELTNIKLFYSENKNQKSYLNLIFDLKKETDIYLKSLYQYQLDEYLKKNKQFIFIPEKFIDFKSIGNMIKMSPNKKMIITANSDFGPVNLWDIDGHLIKRLTYAKVRSIEFDMKNKYCVLGVLSEELRIFNLRNFKSSSLLIDLNVQTVNAISFTNEEDPTLIATEGKKIYFYRNLEDRFNKNCNGARDNILKCDYFFNQFNNAKIINIEYIENRKSILIFFENCDVYEISKNEPIISKFESENENEYLISSFAIDRKIVLLFSKNENENINYYIKEILIENNNISILKFDSDIYGVPKSIKKIDDEDYYILTSASIVLKKKYGNFNLIHLEHPISQRLSNLLDYVDFEFSNDKFFIIDSSLRCLVWNNSRCLTYVKENINSPASLDVAKNNIYLVSKKDCTVWDKTNLNLKLHVSKIKQSTSMLDNNIVNIKFNSNLSTYIIHDDKLYDSISCKPICEFKQDGDTYTTISYIDDGNILTKFPTSNFNFFEWGKEYSYKIKYKIFNINGKFIRDFDSMINGYNFYSIYENKMIFQNSKEIAIFDKVKMNLIKKYSFALPIDSFCKDIIPFDDGIVVTTGFSNFNKDYRASESIVRILYNNANVEFFETSKNYIDSIKTSPNANIIITTSKYNSNDYAFIVEIYSGFMQDFLPTKNLCEKYNGIVIGAWFFLDEKKVLVSVGGWNIDKQTICLLDSNTGDEIWTQYFISQPITKAVVLSNNEFLIASGSIIYNFKSNETSNIKETIVNIYTKHENEYFIENKIEKLY